MTDTVKKFLDAKYLLWTLLASPFLWLANGLRDGHLFYGEILHASGELSARLLLLSLAITPLRLFFSDSNWPGGSGGHGRSCIAGYTWRHCSRSFTGYSWHSVSCPA